MHTEDSRRKDALKAALNVLLKNYSCQMVGEEDYAPVRLPNLINTSITDSNDQVFRLSVSEMDWREFEDQVVEIFENKVQTWTVKMAFSEYLEALCQPVMQFPFRTEGIETHLEAFFYELDQHFQFRGEALVPLYNIEYFSAGDLVLQLANAKLHSGNGSTAFAVKASESPLMDQVSAHPAECSFLAIPVSGDAQSCTMQAEAEMNNALMLLRFVMPQRHESKYSKTRQRNPALTVSSWNSGKQVMLVHEPDKDGLCYSNVAPPELLAIFDNNVEYAWNYFGLHDLNVHFQRGSEHNQISRRIRAAIAMYDSGLRALTRWEMDYRYTVSVEIALPSQGRKKKEGISRNLEILIGYGNLDLANSGVDLTNTRKAIERYERSVADRVDRYTANYSRRSGNLHGDGTNYGFISNSDLEISRSLAHTAIRLIAKTCNKYEWTNDEEQNRYFATTRIIDAIAELSDCQKLDLAHNVELFRGKLRLMQDTFPDDIRQFEITMCRLFRTLNNHAPNQDKVRNLSKRLKCLAVKLPTDGEVQSIASNIVRLVEASYTN